MRHWLHKPVSEVFTTLMMEAIKKGKKVKLSHYMPWRHMGERRYSSYSFLTSALDGGEWSASRLGRALPPGKNPRYPLDSNKHFLNVSQYLTGYTAQHSRRQPSSSSNLILSDVSKMVRHKSNRYMT
jgi:hypothetical protein